MMILTEAGKNGRMRNIDIEATHQGHDIWHCFDECREKNFSHERADTEAEKAIFSELVQTITSEAFDPDMATFNDTAKGALFDGKEITIIEETELGDDESVYVDAPEIPLVWR